MYMYTLYYLLKSFYYFLSFCQEDGKFVENNKHAAILLFDVKLVLITLWQVKIELEDGDDFVIVSPETRIQEIQVLLVSMVTDLMLQTNLCFTGNCAAICGKTYFVLQEVYNNLLVASIFPVYHVKYVAYCVFLS